jgi:peptide deformylase
MTILKIHTIPDPVLRRKAQRVRAVTPQMRQLIDDMVETMRAAPGVGLAAPQVGVSQRIIVVEFAPEPQEGQENQKPPLLYTLVNPEIVRRSKETEFGHEACLSIPGYFGEVQRAQKITVQGLNRQGQRVRVKAQGWLARIFQHEIDHLDGILYIDRATKMWKAEEAEESDTVPA